MMTADDTRRALAAGWQLIDPADDPGPCIGSGQLAAFVDGMVTCPVCGRRVAAVLPTLEPPSAPYLVTHDPLPPELPAPRRSDPNQSTLW